jgi:hypothetical protein
MKVSARVSRLKWSTRLVNITSLIVRVFTQPIHGFCKQKHLFGIYNIVEMGQEVACLKGISHDHQT